MDSHKDKADFFSLGDVAEAIERRPEIVRQWLANIPDDTEGYVGSEGRGHRRKFSRAGVARLAVFQHLLVAGLPIPAAHLFAWSIPGILQASGGNDLLVVWKIRNEQERSAEYHRRIVPNGVSKPFYEIAAEADPERDTALTMLAFGPVVYRALSRLPT